MSPAAITARILELGRLSANGVTRDPVDMSPAAITARLEELGACSRLCFELMAASPPAQGAPARPRSG